MKIEKDLVLKVMNGDKTAFSEIYYSCYKDFYKFAFYTIGDAEEAEDVVSDTFLEIWRGIGRLRKPEAFSSWAFKILSIRCKNAISNIIKSRGEYSYEDFIESPIFEIYDTDETFYNNADLAAALLKLEPDERMIVVLSVLYGYTRKEISEMIGKPRGTVGSKFYRALRKLRKQMGGQQK